jgi:quercetin dioxygenase-like cupin family protein
MAHRLISLPALMGLALSTTLLAPALAFDEGHGGTHRGVVVETLARSTQDWTGTRLPPYPVGQPQVTVLRITVPPGVRLDPHHHPVINAGVLLQGRLKVVMEKGPTMVLESGDALVEVVNRIHHGESLGPQPAVIVVVYAGVEGLPLTVRDGTPAPAPAPPAPRPNP